MIHLSSTASDALCTTHAHYIQINSGCGKRDAHKNWPMVKPEKAAPTCYLNYLVEYLPYAGGLATVNAIGT